MGDADDALVPRPMDQAVVELTRRGPYSGGVTSGVSDLVQCLPWIVARAALATGLLFAAARALDKTLRPLVTGRMDEGRQAARKAMILRGPIRSVTGSLPGASSIRAAWQSSAWA